MLATEWGTGEVAWSMFWFFVVLGWFMLTIRVLWNVLRSTSLGGGAKALWVAAVLVFPFLGVFAYMAISGDLEDPVRDQQYQDMASSGYYPRF
jgi:hypothetical protein